MRGLLTPYVPTTVKNEQLVEKRRKQLVLAAIKLFSRKGFHKATLRDLADEAGISHGNIYDYVGSKEDIFFLLHEFMVDLVDAGLSQSIENVKDPVEKLRRMVRSEFNIMFEWADAILIIYQESHILRRTKELLYKFLERERDHIQRFQDVLQECVSTGACRYVDNRIVANLIKIMADSWVLKRWDLREHVTQLEMEKGILDLVFNGLVSHEIAAKADSERAGFIGAKLALVLGSGSLVGRETEAFLLSKGLETAVYRPEQSESGELFLMRPRTGNVQSASRDGVIRVSYRDLLTLTHEKFGAFDFLLYDLGICRDYLTAGAERDQEDSARTALHVNLRTMFEITSFFDKEVPKRGVRRIIFLAPWRWDEFVDPYLYQMIKSAVASVTRALARTLACINVTVNCIVPGFLGGIANQRFLRVAIPSAPALPERGGEISDVLEGIDFFLSQAGGSITGQVLEVGMDVTIPSRSC
jgi:AcrR family transcriptional regulator